MTDQRLRSEPAPSIRRLSNLDAWNKAKHRRPEIEADVARFKNDLYARLGPKITPFQRARASMAVALYTGVALLQHKLLTAPNKYTRTSDLLTVLPAVAGALDRQLRALEAAGSDAADDPTETLHDYIKSRGKAKAQ